MNQNLSIKLTLIPGDVFLLGTDGEVQCLWKEENDIRPYNLFFFLCFLLLKVNCALKSHVGQTKGADISVITF